MQKPKYYLIDSRDRISGSSHRFTIQCKPGLEPIRQIKLCGVSIPLTNYIIEASNQNIYFSDATDDFVGVMNPGVYDYITILPEIKRAMEATAYPGLITATYNTSTYKFSLVGSVLFQLTFGTNTLNSAAYILGFNNVDTGYGPTFFLFESDDVAHLSIPPYFYINVDNFSTQCSTSNGDICTFVIFSQNNSGYVNFHWDKTHYSLNIDGPPSREPLQIINVNLKMRGGNYFNLNDTDWSMLLELVY